MKKFTKKALLEHLAKSEKDDIVAEVMVLFDKFNNVKEYYKSELSDNSSLLDKYKKKITDAYAAANPSDRRTNMNLNKLISDFKRIAVYQTELAELLIHRVEYGVKAFTRNPKRSEAFYNCVINSFEEAIKIIRSGDTVEEYRKRIFDLVERSADSKYGTGERMKTILKENEFL